MQVMIHPRLRELQPGPSAKLERANAVARESTDPALLELCRCLVVTLLDPGANPRSSRGEAPEIEAAKLSALGNWANSAAFSPLERAALDYTEQFMTSVSTMSDDQVEALRAHLDDAAVYAFAAALYVIEMTERLRMVSGAVLGEDMNR
jgi:hypothetical protein